jgi:thiamine biosynthesis lipoprotein
MQRFQQTRKALGSEAVLTIVIQPTDDCGVIFAELWRQIDAFEERFSRFNPSSELSIFNSTAGIKQTISKEFSAILRTTVAMQKATSGLFNPLILPALQRAGYKGSWPEPNTVRSEVSFEGRTAEITNKQIILGNDWAKIDKGGAVDLGGIGKGYLLDQLGEYLVTVKVTDFWLSLGGDILCSGFDIDESPWSIAIQDVHNNNQAVKTIINRKGSVMGIATSGRTKRQGVHNDITWHHIIDPRTENPAETNVLMATATAVNATSADVFAKCLVIVGSYGAKAFCRANHLDVCLQLASTFQIYTEGVGIA